MRRTSFAVVSILGAAGLAHAQYTTPNVINQPSSIFASLGGMRFVNHGLVGVGRIPSFLDAQGSTYGSVSALAIAPGTWSYAPATGFSGTFLTVPDRGRNDPATSSFIDYQTRIQMFDFTFNPLATGSGVSQDQITFNYTGMTLATEATGEPLVGNDPDTFTTTLGALVPRLNGNITVDAEGIIALDNGNYYISDEYGSAIYYISASGTLLGVINPPDALLPRDAATTPHFTSTAAPVTGRRQNQGMEAIGLTPDGAYLIAVNQSAAIQDSSSGGQPARRHTRVLIFDIQTNPVPTAPIGHYVLELPTYRNDGNGSAVNATASQSELVALSDTQFLLLPRDSNGRGSQNGQPLVYTSIVAADISGATNLVGTAFHDTTPVAPGGVLDPSITAVATQEVINMLNLADLTRFGLNLDITTQQPDGDANTFSEKWEGLALVPDLSTPEQDDYFLFVANDNDFIATNGVMAPFGIAPFAYSDPFDHDTMFLAYRVTLDLCYADCDGGGTLNIFDYICFGNAYSMNDPYADCDGNGTLNVFDYICFGNLYAVGCQ
ncbi:MAG: esterase-like activity of phytase family protein [Phycisphaeraceae bacterium]|nr:esterase-like activity of phytase family protein [Phycisphaerales bacterium]MCB9859883.1 esterase-like activity of phytase family protein [Phycisphaeraceae bacterium]